MKGRTTGLCQALAIACLLGLTGCERTTDDIAAWQQQGNAKKIIGELDNEHRTMRMEAARALGEMKSTQATEPLAALLTNTDPQLEVIAIESLAAIGSDAAAKHLIKAIEAEDLQVTVAAINGLGSMKSSEAIHALTDALGHIDDKISTAAAEALGHTRDDRAIPALADKVTARSSTLRLNSVNALAGIGGEDAHDALVVALGDISPKVREAAIDAFVVLGDAAEPYALVTLRHSKAPARQSSVDILRKIEAVPSEGDDFVWYGLAPLPDKRKVKIDRELVASLAEKGKAAVPALLKAAEHPTPAIREHAFRALETIGESCVADAIKAANENASPEGKYWFSQRKNWAGAPAWRIDLWAAVAALNPEFKMFSIQTSIAIEKMLTEAASGVRREQIPLLIALTGNIQKDEGSMDLFGMDTASVPNGKYRPDAIVRLESSGAMAVLPLIAAVEGSNQNISEACASVLGRIGDARAIPVLAELLQIEIDAGRNLTQSSLYGALVNFDDPSVEPILMKVRPSEAYARRLFSRQYPGIRVTNARSKNALAAYSEPIGYELAYIKDGKTGELMIRFEKNSDEDWTPSTPLPAELP